MVIKILVLASNPVGTVPLQVNHEIRSITESHERSPLRREFSVIDKSAPRISDLQRIILEENPQILHFCGHGTGHRGLILENDSGQLQLVSTEALTNLLEIRKREIKCVVLNACHTELQGEQIKQHVNFVVATQKEIRDDAALLFTKGFYDALFSGKIETYRDAYELGCNRIQLELFGRNNLERKLVPIYSESEGDYINQEQNKVLLFLEKNPPNLIFSNDTDSNENQTNHRVKFILFGLLVGIVLFSVFVPSYLWVNAKRENWHRQKMLELQKEAKDALEEFREAENEDDETIKEETQQKALWSAIKTGHELENFPTDSQGNYLTTAPFFALQQIVEQFDSSSSIEKLDLPPSLQSPLWAIDFSDTHIITGGWDRKIYLCDVSDLKNKECKEPLDAKHIVTDVSFNKLSSDIFAAATQDGRIFIESIGTQELTEIEKNESAVLSLSFRSDEKVIAFGRWDGQVILKEVAEKKSIKYPHDYSKYPIRSISYQPKPNSKLLAKASEDGTVYLESPEDGPYLLPISKKRLHSVDFSPDGELLAVTGEDGLISLWKVSEVLYSSDKLSKVKWNAKQSWVTSAVFNSNQQKQTIASAGWDGTVKLWDYSGNKLAEWKVDSPITDLSFNREGNKIAVSKLDGTVNYWSIPTLEQLIFRGCGFIKVEILEREDKNEILETKAEFCS